MIWTPPVSIPEQRDFKQLGGQAGETFNIERNGSVFWTRKIVSEIECNSMNFGRLPFDTQYCMMSVIMWRYQDLVLSSWASNRFPNEPFNQAIEVLDPNKMQAGVWKASVHGQSSSIRHYEATGSNIPILKVCLKFERNSANYKFVILVTIILVLANYSGLYINPAAVPGRVALSFLSFLMVLNQVSAVFQSFPPVAGDRKVCF